MVPEVSVGGLVAVPELLEVDWVGDGPLVAESGVSVVKERSIALSAEKEMKNVEAICQKQSSPPCA